MNYSSLEINVGVICAALGSFFCVAVGGFDVPVKSLLALIITDYVSGVYAAWRTGTLSSGAAFIGIRRKLFIVAVVVFGNMLDGAMGLDHTFRTMIVCGYAGMEGLSIVENVDRMGYGQYIPSYLRDKLLQLRQEKEGAVNANSEPGRSQTGG